MILFCFCATDSADCIVKCTLVTNNVLILLRSNCLFRVSHSTGETVCYKGANVFIGNWFTYQAYYSSEGCFS